jgi:predicted SAM-dependent methyltransferase
LLHQRYKDICFLVISKANLPNYWLHRLRSSLQSGNGAPLHLHIGCGPKYLPGFVNIDAVPLHKLDLWLDARNGLPYRTASVDSVYCTHVLEHFYHNELLKVLSECSRVLKPGGGIRLIVPNLNHAIRAYTQSRYEWFGDQFPHHFDSLGGRFSNYMFCDGQHRTAFDFDYMREMLVKAGFTEVNEVSEDESRLYGERVPPYQPKSDLPPSLYVEAFK